MKQSRKGPFLFENERQEVGATNTADVSAARPSTRHKEKLRAIAAAILGSGAACLADARYSGIALDAVAGLPHFKGKSSVTVRDLIAPRRVEEQPYNQRIAARRIVMRNASRGTNLGATMWTRTSSCTAALVLTL